MGEDWLLWGLKEGHFCKTLKNKSSEEPAIRNAEILLYSIIEILRFRFVQTKVEAKGVRGPESLLKDQSFIYIIIM